MSRKRVHDTNLPKGVYRHGRGFRMRVYVEGKPAWLRLKARTVPDVWLEHRQHQAPTEGTIGAGIKRYKERKVPEKLRTGEMSAATWRTEERRCDAIDAVFGHMRPDVVTAEHLYKYAERAGDGWRKLKRFSAMWRYFLKWGMAKTDPFIRFDWPKQMARTRYVTDDELAAARDVALKVAETRPSALLVWAALTMILRTGRRVTDVRKLTLPQIVKGTGIRFVEGKTKKVTMVRWSPALERDIEDIKARLHTHTKIRPMHLICNRDGQACSEGSLNQAFQRLRPFIEAAGIEHFQLRDIRAKYGTDHPDGERALRHSSPATFRKHYDRKGVEIDPLE